MAWAAAGVLGPRDVLPVGPQPLPMSHCCAVTNQSPHTLLKGRVQRSGLAARRVATRKATGDPAPTEERAMRKRAVCGYVRPQPRKKRGTEALCNFTFTQPVTGGSC